MTSSSDSTHPVTPDSSYDFTSNPGPLLDPAPGVPEWTSQDYMGLVEGRAASKLASSAVAPLVAAARGYARITAESAEEFASKRGLPDRRSREGRNFRQLFADGGDALVLPWFPVEQMSSTEQGPTPPRATCLQVRPSNPRTDDAGSLVKYEFVTGAASVIDVHPAIARSWMRSASKVMVTQGLLKADSALSALLRAHHDEASLAARPEEWADRGAALQRLRELLDTIPVEDRVVILAMGGPGGSRSNPDWDAIDLTDRDVLLALDGDIETRHDAWTVANELYHFLHSGKRARPSVVRLAAHPRVLQELADGSRVGFDDFFARWGVWLDLGQMTEIDLPAAPKRVYPIEFGDWRMAPGGTETQEFVAVPTADGRFEKGRGEWVTRNAFGARITDLETHRAPTAEEKAGHPFGSGTAGITYPSRVRIEIAWEDETGDTRESVVRGPASILGETPAFWRREGAELPDEVLLRVGWPPERGRQWLQAMKDHRTTELRRSTVWSTMGWVPAPNSMSQAFIAGRDVIAATPEVTAQTRTGAVDKVLSNAERFGLHDVYTGPGLTDPTGQYNLAEDLRTLLKTYVTDTPWRDMRIAVTMMAIALRPAVPLATSAVAYFVGAPQKGKSWSARQLMSFWQGRPGTWRSTLPGSANDTFPTSEAAIGRTPIWVLDDLAPSSDRQHANRQEAMVGDLIRATHNRAGKRRMTSNMREREVPTPMALLIVTAENEPSVQSVRERSVAVEFQGLRLEQMQRADALANKSTTASRVTAAMIRMFIADGEQRGWAAVTDELRKYEELATDSARDVLRSNGIATQDSSRPAQAAADLSVGLYALSKLLRQAGLTSEARDLDWDGGRWMRLLTEQVSLGHLNKADAAPGRVLLRCVRNLLLSGAAHIGNLSSPGQPPLGDTSDIALGWSADSDGQWHPRGTTIGHMIVNAEEPDLIWITPDDAFELAQKHYPRLIPHGTKSESSWRNVWELKLTHPRHPTATPGRNQKQYRLPNSGARGYGVPISLATLLNSESEEQGAQDSTA